MPDNALPTTDHRARWRQHLTWALAAIWLLDAHLQFQQFMFTAGKNGFPQSQIAPAGQGSPGFVSGPVDWAVRLMDSDIGFWNFVFAALQLAIGLGLLFRRTLRISLAVSIVWALGLWWMGEGLGGMFAGAVSPLMGLPGAAVIYAVIAALLWPRTDRDGDSVATSGPLHPLLARGLWAALWLFFAVESLLPDNRSPRALHDMVAGMADGEPGWMKSIDSWGANLFGSHGLAYSIAITVICVLVAAAPFVATRLPQATIALLGLGIVFSLFVWLVGEDLGGIATGQATDPNTGPLLVLLALTFWPITGRVARAAVNPAGRPATTP